MLLLLLRTTTSFITVLEVGKLFRCYIVVIWKLGPTGLVQPAIYTRLAIIGGRRRRPARSAKPEVLSWKKFSAQVCTSTNVYVRTYGRTYTAQIIPIPACFE